MSTNNIITLQRSKQATRPVCLPVPACLWQAQAMVLRPGLCQAGQAKTLEKPGRPLKIDRQWPVYNVF